MRPGNAAGASGTALAAPASQAPASARPTSVMDMRSARDQQASLHPVCFFQEAIRAVCSEVQRTSPLGLILLLCLAELRPRQ